MAISTIFKGIFFASLLAAVLSQFNSGEENFGSDDGLRPSAKERILELTDSEEREVEEKIAEDQAAHAVYDFATSIVDGIMDNTQLRTESRRGRNITGSYSYSDGFFRRSVHYVADKNGFRIISEEIEPLGNGPRVNPDGHASVRTSIAGENFQYNITKADIGTASLPTKLPGRA